MFADDIALVKEIAAKYGPLLGPIVEVGGLERPCIADYVRTIEAMKTARTPEEVAAAQTCRYLNIARPLSFLGEYIIENPEAGGLPVEELHTKYNGTIGTAILLSVLEHVANPFEAIARLWNAMRSGGIAIVSVPFMFPHHPSPEDNFRFTPTGLRHLFAGSLVNTSPMWEILECEWRLKIPADAGVLGIRDGRPQAIESCYIVARAAE